METILKVKEKDIEFEKLDLVTCQISLPNNTKIIMSTYTVARLMSELSEDEDIKHNLLHIEQEKEMEEINKEMSKEFEMLK